ncbi:MAG: PTS sugar transporter subunit IIB [Breznakia sp.]
MKILCVCGLGQGTSLILRMNVEEVLNDMGIRADVDNTDVSSASSEVSDFIITNKVLSSEIANDTPRIIIENYFDKEEIQKEIEKTIK